MDSVTNISTVDENGVHVVRPMTAQELAELEATRAAMEPTPLPAPITTE